MSVSQPVMPPKRLSLQSVLDFIKKNWKDYIFLILIAGVIVTTDQWLKVLVRAKVPLGGDWLPPQLAWLMPYARIRYWYNSGAAFGIFQNGNPVFMTLAVIVSLVILYYFPRTSRKDWWLRLALALQFSGAVGNLVDRLQFGHVTDFISVGTFAIFNIADASITVGVVVLILGVWLTERKDKHRLAKQPAGTPVPDDIGNLESANIEAASPKNEAKSE
jgi:signal peptidase II